MHPDFSWAKREKNLVKQSTHIKRDEINIMNIINNKTFNLPNSLLINDNRYMKVALKFKLIGIVVVFWPSTRPKMPFRVMHRKEVTHSNGSYERKSRGRKLADEMGRGKKNSHGTLIDWCIGREWPVNCMTVISAWWRSNMRFQRSSRRLSGRWTII